LFYENAYEYEERILALYERELKIKEEEAEQRNVGNASKSTTPQQKLGGVDVLIFFLPVNKKSKFSPETKARALVLASLSLHNFGDFNRDASAATMVNVRPDSLHKVDFSTKYTIQVALVSAL